MNILSTYFENYNKNITLSNESINFDILLENKEIKKRMNNNLNIEENNISIFGYKYKPL